MEVGVKMKGGLFFMIRRCFRSVFDHPFLVGVLCFLIFLHRSFPFIFSLLVSASPVLVCTAALLGTLLSFGQPNIPEIEREGTTEHEVVLVKMGTPRDAAVIERNESYHVERYSEKKRDERERVLADIHREGSLDDTAPLIDEQSHEMQIENGEIPEANRELGDEERLGDEGPHATVPKIHEDEHLESDYEISDAESFDSERVNVDSLDSPPRSPWKRVDDREEEEDEDEEENDVLESESDRAESSSPDASMADLLPIFDELHPLLDEEAAQPDHMSHEGSDAASERSLKSSVSSDESDDKTENDEALEVPDDNEDGDDEEDVQGDKEEQMKSAISWTEEDQKNLMDLGSSEIERNQRLENLILRRRARKNMSMVPERNLIDLESFDLGFNIAPISTARQNPFDLPRDSYDNSGLPPVPGSAPSILLPRRNPFDIPYDSSEEKPNLMGDGFQGEFTRVQSREPFFRRHESFNVGPSIFAPTKQERQDAKLRPYFVPERMDSGPSSYSPFQRQSSELSDSKVSSVPETDSIGSVEDTVERGLSDEDNLPEQEVILETKEATNESSSGDPELISNGEDIPEEYTPREPESIASVEHVGHGSQSSEEDESLELGQMEKRDFEHDRLELPLEDAEDHCEERGVASFLEVQVTGSHPNSKTVEQIDSRGSSYSSLSEVSEKVFNETEAKRLSMLEGGNDGFNEDPGISTQTSVGSDLGITVVEGMPLRDPIYDSSPPSVRKNFSSSSMSSEVHIESDLCLPPVLVKRMVPLTERGSEGSSPEMNVPGNIETSPKSPILHPVNEHEVIEMRVPGNVILDFPGVEQRSSTSVEGTTEENLKIHQTQGQAPISCSDKDIHGVVEFSEDKGQLEEEKHLLVSEKYTFEALTPPLEDQLTTDRSMDKDEIMQSPNSDADIYHEAKEKLMSTPSAEGNASLFLGIAMDERTFEHLNEAQLPNTPVGSFEDRRKMQILNIRELDHNISETLNSPLSPDFISIPSMSSGSASPHVEMQTIIEEDDEIKDIDEELLSELDSVGDFSVTKWELASNEFEKHKTVSPAQRASNEEANERDGKDTPDHEIIKHETALSMGNEGMKV